ncbi:TerC family protein [Deinococcus yavapaiensis]|uniref:Tellurite resistance protein TerC n=1 Tax=Deinococcus yavapaiensis KR-236 TaxID=694435 RepID=A0A318SA67_9DEIO|nr:TerC family protein [Deinococcus yavapaiensis]PYE53380.1 tellurite resistance protein TerC [Deinococcus yavapaiensis KR-236]
MDLPLWVWFAFIGGVLTMLALDLGVFNRKAHVISVKEAGIWTTVWVSLSLIFAAVIWNWLGPQKGVDWLTGYVVEYSLAVDNIFVFVLVFAAFGVPAQYRHRVLFWGVIGALLMRGAMILVGAQLIDRFHWILYFFGAFLVYAGIKMFKGGHGEEVDLEKNVAVRIARRFFKISPTYDGQKFFTVQNGVRMATPLFLVLLVVEFTDLIFAVDSIPAIFAITTDPFIVFTSNVMAILGLRSMYFLLAHVVDRFIYLKTGLAVILSFIGVKLLLIDVYKIPTSVSLAVIVTVLTLSVVTSLYATRHQAPKPVLQDSHD